MGVTDGEGVVVGVTEGVGDTGIVVTETVGLGGGLSVDEGLGVGLGKPDGLGDTGVGLGDTSANRIISSLPASRFDEGTKKFPPIMDIISTRTPKTVR